MANPEALRKGVEKTEAELELAKAPTHLNILLADDDSDDRLFFKTIVDEFPLPASLIEVHNGEQLMQFLTVAATALPDVLFLDLNMPRKNGLECLAEIKHNDKLKGLPVILYSTSAGPDVTDQLYQNGAQHFIQKPSDFLQFKRVIHYALTLIMQKADLQRAKSNFILTGENDPLHPGTF
jgi:CheY-like chemotaxis protein